MVKTKIKKGIALILSLCAVCSCVLSAGADTGITRGRCEITVDGNAPAREISDNMFGIFIEDINQAIDGGLSSDLIRNGSFEQKLSWWLDHDFRMTGWETDGGDGALETESPMNESNPSYFHANGECTLINRGYPDTGAENGISLKKGKSYDFSLRCRGNGKITAAFKDEGGKTAFSESFEISTDKFEKKQFIFKPAVTAVTYLTVTIGAGCDADFFRLVPCDSFGYGDPVWKDASLRPDIVDALRDLHPSFVRFPGGCLAEGAVSWDQAYRWKTTIGPLEEREQIPNLWGYNQSMSVGFYEYFLLCEHLGAKPVPVVHSGLMCQSRGRWVMEIGSEEFNAHIQDIMDLIEYANGDATTTWGRVRAENGHPEPFNLEYLAIGNENWMEDYWERFDVIYNAVKREHPEIRIISSSGPFPDGEYYDYAWEQINEKYTDTVVDEHYYVATWWPYVCYDRYDSFDRDGAKVFVGEYAVHRGGGEQITKNNLQVAVDEAVLITSFIRNSDIVEMACYAPLLAREGYTQWCPNLIWYNSEQVIRTPSYYVQQLYMQSIGTQSVMTEVNGTEGMFAAASVDPAEKKIYVYVVNANSKTQDVRVNLDGFRDIDLVGEMRYLGSGLFNVANNFGMFSDFISPRYEKVTAVNGAVTKKIGPHSMNVICLSYDGENAYSKPGSDSGYKAGNIIRTLFYDWLEDAVQWFTSTSLWERIQQLISKENG